MLAKRINLVVGLTTFDTNMLRISVPALARLHRHFLLIIHNDNPAVTITRRMVRALGYRGDVHIINSSENVGTLFARMAIVSAATRFAPNAGWIVFADDDDMLLDIDVPSVSSDNFAVVQNMVVVQHSVSALLRLMQNPNDYSPDDENITIVRPHMGLVGSLIRMDVMVGLARVLNFAAEDIRHIDDSLDYRPPYDAIMWTALNTYARGLNPNAVPIYMDRVGYIAIKVDASPMKYGRLRVPARAVRDHYVRVIARFDAALRAALAAAAPLGHTN